MPIPTKLDERPLDEDAPSAAYSTAWLPPGVMRPFVLITGLFFLWGIPNNLNDVLIRQFMKSFEISRFQAGLVQSAFYLGYFLLALPAGLLMKRRGYKSGFLTGFSCLRPGAFSSFLRQTLENMRSSWRRYLSWRADSLFSKQPLIHSLLSLVPRRVRSKG